MAGFLSLLRRVYLIVYNWTVFSGWAQVLYLALKTLNESGHENVYKAVERPLQLAQTAAVLEILHGLVGLVRSPITATLPRISSRFGGMASNRPLLLIEPPYRINGEDKTKSQTRPPRPSGEQGGKTTMRRTPDVKADTKVGVTSKPDSKADAKIPEAQNSDTREDHNGASALMSDPKVADKVTVKSTSKSVPKTNSKVAEISSSESKVLGSTSDNATKGRKLSVVGLGNATQNSKIDKPVSSSEGGSDKAGGLRESKQEGDKLPSKQPPISRPVLEENIVLGVALEGSKRTLPIEEGMDSPQPAVKELSTASRNGNGSSIAEKERKDSQILTTPSSTSGVCESNYGN